MGGPWCGHPLHHGAIDAQQQRCPFAGDGGGCSLPFAPGAMLLALGLPTEQLHEAPLKALLLWDTKENSAGLQRF